MAKYGKKAQETVQTAVKRQKAGDLKSGRSSKMVTSRKQFIAIGLCDSL